MKKTILSILILALSTFASAEIKWGQVLGGVVFATASYYMAQDGFSQVEATYPATVIVGMKGDIQGTSGTFYNSGNVVLQNYSLRGYALTWKKYISPTGQIWDVEDQRIPFEFNLGSFQMGQSIPVVFSGLTSSATVQLVHEENWDYVKTYKTKAPLQGYIALVTLSMSVYAIIDGLGIFGEVKTAGLRADLYFPAPGTTALNLKYCF